MQKTKKTKKVAAEEPEETLKPTEEVEDEERMEEDDEEDVDEDDDSNEENDNEPQDEEGAENEAPEANAGEEPPKKRKKLDKKTAEKEKAAPTEEELFKQKLLLKGDIIRAGKCSKDEKQQQLQELRNLLGGKYGKYVYNHAVSRVIEWMIKLSEPKFATKLVTELKDQLLVMAKKKYSTHVVRCLIEKADKPTFEILHAALSSSVIKMLQLTPSTHVVNEMFKKSNPEQKQVLKQNFYGNSFKVYKTKNVKTLKDVSELTQTEKDSIFNEVNSNLTKIIEKNGLKSELTVSVLRDYMEHLEAGSAKHTALVAILQGKFVELSDHKDGAWLAAQCVWNSSAKERKQIMKLCKEKLMAMATSNVGSLILIGMMDCIDDTTLINKIILQPLIDGCVEVCSNKDGVRVLAFAVRPRSTHFLHPETIKFLDEGATNQHSKKDAAVRQGEIKSFVVPAIASIVSKDLSPWVQDPQRFLFMKALLENSDLKEVKEVLEKFAELLADPAHEEKSVFKGKESKMPMIELPFAQKLVMHLIKEEKNRFANDSNYKPIVCEILISNIKKNPELWLKSNRGVLTFLCMMETEIPSVLAEVKQMVAPHIDLVKAQGESKNASSLLALIGEVSTETPASQEEKSKKKKK